MSEIVVFVQQQDGALPKSALVALTAAKELEQGWSKSGISTVCCGSGAAQAATELLGYGVEKAFYSEHALLSQYMAGPHAFLLEQVAAESGASVFVAAATTTGKDLMPRLAAALDAGQASDIVAVNDDGSLKRPMYAGDVLADVEIATDKRVVTVRSTAFAPAEKSSGSGQAVELSFEPQAMGEFVSFETSGGDRPELTDAEVVVSGGRALKSEENFSSVLEPLADVLGAAIGASRAAVDSGYAPNDWQVGQTGKVVAPDLYIAVGISGAIQHIAGMKDSKVIVAINTDPDAPIFEVADYGLVADLFEAVPQLAEEIQKHKASQ